MLGPAASPENSYSGKGGNAAIDMGTSHDQTLVSMTLRDYIRFAKLLTPEDPLIAQAQRVLPDVQQPKIGLDGALQEWSEPFGECEPGHRHLSHAYGLMPGRYYSLRQTPKYAEAIRKSLEKRLNAGYHGMGWSFGWMSSLQLRLNDPERALKTIDGAARYLCGNLFTSAVGYLQVSDMNGVPNAINEMLLRTDESLVEILPALPKRFASDGSFKNFCADKGFVFSAAWQAGKVTSLTVTSRLGGTCRIRYNGIEKEIQTKKGEVVRLL